MQKKTLLVVNGSQVLMDITKRIIERAGYNVRCALGIQGAKEQLGDITPDGIILGNELPDGSGFDCLRELKEKYDIPILFFSNDKDDELPALKAGANDFLKKPYDYDVLVARINMMMNGQRDGEPWSSSELEQGSNDARMKSAQSISPGELPRRRKTDWRDRDRSGRYTKNRPAVVNYIVFGAMTCLALILAVIVISTVRNRGSEIFLGDDQVPLGEFNPGLAPGEGDFPFETAKTGAQTLLEYGIDFPVDDSITVPAGAEEIEILIANPARNSYYFTFELILEDTGELLYSSALVMPGMHIDGFRLNRALQKGEHGAALEVQVYEVGSFYEAAHMTVTFSIVAE